MFSFKPQVNKPQVTKSVNDPMAQYMDKHGKAEEEVYKVNDNLLAIVKNLEKKIQKSPPGENIRGFLDEFKTLWEARTSCQNAVLKIEAEGQKKNRGGY